MHVASCSVYDSDGESAWPIDRCKQVPGVLFDGVIVRRVISDPVDNLRVPGVRRPIHCISYCLINPLRLCGKHTRVASEARVAVESGKMRTDALSTLPFVVNSGTAGPAQSRRSLLEFCNRGKVCHRIVSQQGTRTCPAFVLRGDQKIIIWVQSFQVTRHLNESRCAHLEFLIYFWIHKGRNLNFDA